MYKHIRNYNKFPPMIQLGRFIALPDCTLNFPFLDYKQDIGGGVSRESVNDNGKIAILISA